MRAELLTLLGGLSLGDPFGVGVDVEEVVRWEAPAARLFTAGEHAHCRAMGRPAESYAGRWCAKEATVKALDPFVRVSVRDVEIGVAGSGAPVVRLNGVDWSGAVRLSISHTGTVAVAVAVAVPIVSCAQSV
jgi:phosphopantetheine--protein transferase-like protein